MKSACNFNKGFQATKLAASSQPVSSLEGLYPVPGTFNCMLPGLL